VISADESGFLEYWQPTEPYEVPTQPGMWTFKSNTDLYEFKKSRTSPTSLTISPNQSHFVTLTASDRQIRVFDLLSGKMTRRYDESLQAIQEMQQAGTAVHRPDDMEFGRRLALDREIQSDEAACKSMNAVWDESGNFVLYATLLGIKGEYQTRTSSKTNLSFSGQYHDKQGGAPPGKRGVYAMVKPQSVPRCSSKERIRHCRQYLPG
jgi:peptidylprolyl isomerase domain and WD repeat-containing protein 1